MLPKEAVDEFKKIYEKEFGKKLSDKAAVKKANDFMRLYKILVKPKK